jgi:hypothetical protein
MSHEYEYELVVCAYCLPTLVYCWTIVYKGIDVETLSAVIN